VLVNIERPASAGTDSAAAHFTARDGGVRVQLSGRDAFVRVELPRGIGRARVAAGDRTVVSVSRGQVTPSAAAASTGVAVVPAR
jgi:hypothetical protein